MNQLLDTNIIVRLLVGDNKDQQKKTVEWFKEGQEGTRTLILTSLVVGETCFVLERFYKRDRAAIANSLHVIISQKWLVIPDRKVLLALWDYYREGLHFVDSFLLASAELTDGNVLNFDKEVNKKLQDF